MGSARHHFHQSTTATARRPGPQQTTSGPTSSRSSSELQSRSSHVHRKLIFSRRLRCACVIWTSRVSQSLVLERAVSTQTTRVPALARSRRDPSASIRAEREASERNEDTWCLQAAAVVQCYLLCGACRTTATITLDLRVLIHGRSLPFIQRLIDQRISPVTTHSSPIASAYWFARHHTIGTQQANETCFAFLLGVRRRPSRHRAAPVEELHHRSKSY